MSVDVRIQPHPASPQAAVAPHYEYYTQSDQALGRSCHRPGVSASALLCKQREKLRALGCFMQCHYVFFFPVMEHYLLDNFQRVTVRTTAVPLFT